MQLHRVVVLGLALTIGVILAVLGAPSAHAASPIHVKPNATGSGDGSDWANATTLQNALAAANPGDEIWVGKGVYTPGLAATDTFTLPSGVGVYGGFAATETDRSARDWVANLTILSGDIGGDDINAAGVVTDTAHITGTNSYHIVTADGVSTPITGTTVLDGFTITAGDATGDAGKEDGAGLYCDGRGAGVFAARIWPISSSVGTAPKSAVRSTMRGGLAATAAQLWRMLSSVAIPLPCLGAPSPTGGGPAATPVRVSRM